MSVHAYQGLQMLVGDLHNHCAVGYGYGTVEDAYTNAKLQLDFASVTAHAHWPDLPVDQPPLAGVVDYHRRGFERAAEGWQHLLEVTEAFNRDGAFVTFPSFEWHSLRYADHNVYLNRAEGEIIRGSDLAEMRAELRRGRARGIETFLIPHHIGYRSGYRGIVWSEFDPEFSPVVEIASMHGVSESDEAPYPYLHSMGPRNGKSTMQYGLAQGHVFGVIGSTDHHSAHPGAYGFGRAAVWAREFTRRGIWDAIAARRTYALTGDRIELAFAINNMPMGSVLKAARERNIEVEVDGGAALDYVEVLYNNLPIERWSAHQAPPAQIHQPVKVEFQVGWGEVPRDQDWRIELEIVGGKLIGIEPRLRGRDIVSPQASVDERFVYSRWERRGENGLVLETATWGNPTVLTPAMQGMCLTISGDAATRIRGTINGNALSISLGELEAGSVTGYVGGFLSPAYSFQRAVPQSASTARLAFTHTSESLQTDRYYVRVCQKNGQWAWCSPIWVSA